MNSSPSSSETNQEFRLAAIVGFAGILLYYVWRSKKNEPIPTLSEEELRAERLRRFEQQQQDDYSRAGLSSSSRDKQATEGKDSARLQENSSSSSRDSEGNQDYQVDNDYATPAVKDTVQPKLLPETADREKETPRATTEESKSTCSEDPAMTAPMQGASVSPASKRQPVETKARKQSVMPREAAAEAAASRRMDTGVLAALVQSPTEESNLSAASPSSSSNSTPYKQKRPAPPAQVLCEALSDVTGRKVSVQRGTGTWGGENWKRRWKHSNMTDDSSPMIVLPLIDYYKPNDDEWIELRAALTSILTQDDDACFDQLTVRQAAEWHARTRTVVRDLDSVSANDKEGLNRCMEVFAKCVASRCAKDVYGQALTISAEDDQEAEEDFIPDGLFGEEIGEGTQGDQAESKTGAFYELLSLLSIPTTVVTKKFLSDLISSCPEKESDRKLAAILVDHSIARVPALKNLGRIVPSSKVDESVNLLSNVLTFSEVTAEFLTKLEDELRTSMAGLKDGKSAREIQEDSLLCNILSLCAFTVPDAGAEKPPQGSRPAAVRLSQFQLSLRALETYPTCVFARHGPQSGLDKVIKDARRTMERAQSVVAVVLKRIMMAGSEEDREGKRWLFRTLGLIARTNDPLVHLLEADLLAVDSAQKFCYSRQFVLGTVSAMLNLCEQSLQKRFEKFGCDAFDPLYLTVPCHDCEASSGGMLGIAEDERRMFSSRRLSDLVTEVRSADSVRFSGSTEFYFLIGNLLRVSLFPCLRIQQEFMRRHGDLFSNMRDHAARPADAQRPLPVGYLEQVGYCTDVLLGWSSFLEDPSFVTSVTNFSLLQLRWLAAVSQDKETGKSFAIIPEWMCKLPAQWLSHVATRQPSLLKPLQADEAVEYATRLLQISDADNVSLSPPVLTALIRIAGAFVQSGVQRARHELKIRELKERRGIRTRQGATEEEKQAEDDMVYEEEIDERWLEIYTSFDANDLGVTVFANQYMLRHLSPSLVSTFSALDAVEGIDIEREHNFDKFSVKFEVAELLLRLWAHPSGEPRAAVFALDDNSIATFASSVAAAISMNLDNALQQIIDIRGMLKNSSMDRIDRRYYDFHAKNLAGGLQQARRHLLLLFSFSEDAKFASILGGFGGQTKVANDLAMMLVQFLDKLTGEDGGTNRELDFRNWKCATSALGQEGFDTTELRTKAEHDLLASRHFASTQFGFDASLLLHLLLGLVTRCHLAAKEKGQQEMAGSNILKAIVCNEDFSFAQMQAAYRRLIATKGATDSGGLFEQDGYVDFDAWKSRFRPIGPPIRDRARRYFVRQDQMAHAQLNNAESPEHVLVFLDDLGRAADAIRAIRGPQFGEEDVKKWERFLLENSSGLEPEDYSEGLGEYVVSSQSFLSNTGDGHFSHSYDSIARSRNSENIGAGKILVKEARKCKKDLPEPHVNASIFVCFAEERMDLCRAVIIGAADTPYSLGLFEFDVFFPAMYPSVPPLVTFKTTGGGSIRFNPNLYNDGKVCISVLGTSHAWNSSQRWDPEKSSLAQVLLSVQSQILAVPDPFFNEGFGHEAMKGTQAGEEGSRRYNNSLRLATLRYAVIAYLKSPPRGFEEVTKRHFAMTRKRLLVQARLWTLEAEGTPFHKRLARAYNELVVLLSDKDLLAESEAVLPPSREDVETLESLDPVFFSGASVLDERKPSAKEEDRNPTSAGPDLAPEQLENPWADSQAIAFGTAESNKPNEQEDVDGEDDFYS